MAKRIQMRKNRFLAIQKIAEQKKLNVDGGPDGDHAPKQTVSSRLTFILLDLVMHDFLWIFEDGATRTAILN